MNNKINANSKAFSEYEANLVDRIYKILPLFEEKNEGLFPYVQSLIYELNGLFWTIEELNSSNYIILLATLESISDDCLFNDELNHGVIKREVFKCLELVKKMAPQGGEGNELFR